MRAPAGRGRSGGDRQARLQAAQERLEREKAAKRQEIAVMRERIRRFKAGEGPKPNLGPFSFDEDKAGK